jgi:hypothetical protein
MTEKPQDFYKNALLLQGNELLIIYYEITKEVTGTMQLSNSIACLDKFATLRLKRVLRFIEEFTIEAKIIWKP